MVQKFGCAAAAMVFPALPVRTQERLPATPGAPDGMKCDAEGNIWCTGPGGLWVFAPSGELIGKVAVPEFVANHHWGGPGWRTLFITASTSLYALGVKVGPHPESFMRGYI